MSTTSGRHNAAQAYPPRFDPLGFMSEAGCVFAESALRTYREVCARRARQAARP